MSQSATNSEPDWSISSDDVSVQLNQNPYQCNQCNDHPQYNKNNTTSASGSTLRSWLQSHKTPHPNPANSPRQKCNETHTHTRKHSIQQPLRAETHNDHWGDDPNLSVNVFRVLSRNINTISSSEHCIQWHGVAAAMKLYCINTICLQETNTKWDDNIHCSVCQALRKTHPRVLLSTSSSTEPSNFETEYQPGGTAIIVTGSNTARILTHGQDPRGMGRWAYIEMLGKNQRKIIIVSAYRFGPQEATIGSNTIYTQQYHILL